jgi:hypothetical protein
MTITSTGCSLAMSERTVFSMHLASLYAGTRTETGSVTGGPQAKPCGAPGGRGDGEQQHQPEAGDDEGAGDRQADHQDVQVMLSEAWTRKIHALPFHRSTPVTGVSALRRAEGLGEVVER